MRLSDELIQSFPDVENYRVRRRIRRLKEMHEWRESRVLQRELQGLNSSRDRGAASALNWAIEILETIYGKEVSRETTA